MPQNSQNSQNSTEAPNPPQALNNPFEASNEPAGQEPGQPSQTAAQPQEGQTDSNQIAARLRQAEITQDYAKAGAGSSSVPAQPVSAEADAAKKVAPSMIKKMSQKAHSIAAKAVAVVKQMGKKKQASSGAGSAQPSGMQSRPAEFENQKNLFALATAPSENVTRDNNCQTFIFKRPAGSDCMEQRNRLPLGVDNVNWSSLCVLEKSVPVHFEIQKDKAAILTHSGFGCQAQFAVRFCLGKGLCKKTCRKPGNDAFLSSLGIENEDSVAAPQEHSEVLSPSEHKLNQEIANMNVLAKDLEQSEPVFTGYQKIKTLQGCQ